MQDESTEMDDGFGYWLAGFADGEGSFNIGRDMRRGKGADACYHDCGFSIALRDDDLPILEETRRRTGLGVVTGREPTIRGGSQAQWLVFRKADCLALVDIFDRYPLRAKKARDFAIWRAAVHEWTRIDGSNGARRRGTRWSQSQRDWSRMASLRRQLIEGRRYPALIIDPLIPSGDMPQAEPDLLLFREVT